VQEDSFEFDREFKDFRVDNPLLRQHKEWDNDSMTGANGSQLLLPQHYNRYNPGPPPLDLLDASSAMPTEPTCTVHYNVGAWT
jgi:hypothetical protein